jgi:hypothetical protein
VPPRNSVSKSRIEGGSVESFDGSVWGILEFATRCTIFRKQRGEKVRYNVDDGDANEGLPAGFRHIALDWKFWSWQV